MAKSTNYYVRKSHRWLGIILAIQFLAWTVSGLYFSWTDIDEIHGDHLRTFSEQKLEFADQNLMSPDELEIEKSEISIISKIELIQARGNICYLIEGKSKTGEKNRLLINAENGQIMEEISRKKAGEIGSSLYLGKGSVSRVDYLTETGKSHEYRGGELPAWQIQFDDDEKTRFYVSASTGNLQKVRTTSWRWFDWLWMTHIMDYDERADINNLLLRIFSVAGLVTVLSGIILFGYTSPVFRKRRRL